MRQKPHFFTYKSEMLTWLIHKLKGGALVYSKTEKVVLDMAKGVAEKSGCFIYDVEYVKEGGNYYLRVYADKEGGINIDECEVISREISAMLDESDPIKQNYFLEVSSPGIERKLRQPEHFEMYKGETVDVGLYKAINGSKILSGTLLGLEDEMVSLEIENETVKIKLSETTYVKLHFEF